MAWVVLCVLALHDFSRPRPLQGPPLRSVALFKHASVFYLFLGILFDFLSFFMWTLLIPNVPTHRLHGAGTISPFHGHVHLYPPEDICTPPSGGHCHYVLMILMAAPPPRPCASGRRANRAFRLTVQCSVAHSRASMIYRTNEWIHEILLCKALNSPYLKMMT